MIVETIDEIETAEDILALRKPAKYVNLHAKRKNVVSLKVGPKAEIDVMGILHVVIAKKNAKKNQKNDVEKKNQVVVDPRNLRAN